MESGQHRISIKLVKGSASALAHLFGVVRDGRAWDADYLQRESTDAWYMHSSSGYLFGNGKQDSDQAGQINGQ